MGSASGELEGVAWDECYWQSRLLRRNSDSGPNEPIEHMEALDGQHDHNNYFTRYRLQAGSGIPPRRKTGVELMATPTTCVRAASRLNR